MSRLPKVAEEIKYSLYRTIKDMATDKKKSAYLKGFWSGFKKDQPELAVIVRDDMENFKNAHEMGAFALGVWLIYAALESQLEADEMNEECGL